MVSSKVIHVSHGVLPCNLFQVNGTDLYILHHKMTDSKEVIYINHQESQVVSHYPKLSSGNVECKAHWNSVTAKFYGVQIWLFAEFRPVWPNCREVNTSATLLVIAFITSHKEILNQQRRNSLSSS